MKIILLLLLAILVGAGPLGCAKLTTTYSTIKVDGGDLEKVRAIVDEAFVQSGYGHGELDPKSGKWAYQKWIGKNRYGKEARHAFWVNYSVAGIKIIVTIERTTLGVPQEDLDAINHELSLLTSKMQKGFAKADVDVTIESNSRWIPLLDK